MQVNKQLLLKCCVQVKNMGIKVMYAWRPYREDDVDIASFYRETGDVRGMGYL